MSANPEFASFARLVESLTPWLDQVVVIGGWAHRLHRLHPLAQPLQYEPHGGVNVITLVPSPYCPLNSADPSVELVALNRGPPYRTSSVACGRAGTGLTVRHGFARRLTESYGERLRGCNPPNMNPEKAQGLSLELQAALEP